MSEARLAAAVEASAFLRLVEQGGGFGAVLHRGDAERGTLLLAISERGRPVTCLTRRLGVDGSYGWDQSGPGEVAGDPASSSLGDYLERRRRNDPDEWQIELDVPSAERFIAETSAAG